MRNMLLRLVGRGAGPDDRIRDPRAQLAYRTLDCRSGVHAGCEICGCGCHGVA